MLNETVSNLEADNSANERLDELEDQVNALETDLSGDSLFYNETKNEMGLELFILDNKLAFLEWNILISGKPAGYLGIYGHLLVTGINA